MKKLALIFVLFLLTLCPNSNAQSVSDLFSASKTQVYWLGIDFSHVKIIGSFNQFSDAGAVTPIELKEKFFTGWNNLVLSEPDKYDVRGMFRKENLIMDLHAITKINSGTATEELETYSPPNYTKEDIEKFVYSYDFEIKEGIGLLLMAEYLSKIQDVAKYHFVAVNLSTNDILIYDTFEGSAGGFGLRNYWARTYYDVICQIRDQKYKFWKREYGMK
jgi:hypothetical protein